MILLLQSQATKSGYAVEFWKLLAIIIMLRYDDELSISVNFIPFFSIIFSIIPRFFNKVPSLENKAWVESAFKFE